MKWHNIYNGFFIIVPFLVSFLLVSSCKKDEESIIRKSSLTGFVQKGPFINGTGIQMAELNSSFAQTGKVFNTVIIDNRGSFEITDVELSSQFVELSATGYYFNEISGVVSTSPLTIYAIADITDISTVNVNLLTHLEKNRALYLIKDGNSFTEAKRTAQQEVLGIFGFQSEDIEDSEKLDITVNKQGSGILLAISLILQSNRSVGDLTELLANITIDIQLDGVLNSPTMLEQLRASAIGLDQEAIRTNLHARYQELGLNTVIPDFETYIAEFLTYTGMAPSISEQFVTNLATTSAVFNATVNANDLTTTVTFEYGTTTNYGISVTGMPSPITGHANTPVIANVENLQPGTIYHVRANSENSLGRVHGDDFTLLTLGQPPTSFTMPATDITTAGATLNGIINPNDLSTVVTFEYGPTIEYGTGTTASQMVMGNSDTPVSASVSGLDPGTVYHFRIIAENSLGKTLSDNQVFSTSGGPPSDLSVYATNIQTAMATLKGRVNPNYFSTFVTFEYGANSDYGSTVQATAIPLSGGEDALLQVKLTDLNPGSQYHFRIKAENELGLTYSEDATFYTTSYISDVDGHTYKTVRISNQVWMADNLQTTKYNDGSIIPLIIEQSASGEPGFYSYGNIENFGLYYNWYTVTSETNGGKNICPDGWHVPTDEEWITMENYLSLNGYNYDGSIGGACNECFDWTRNSKISKAISDTTLWIQNVIEGTIGNEDFPEQRNTTGFSALPAGATSFFGNYGSYELAYYWTSSSAITTLAWCRILFSGEPGPRRPTEDKKIGCSIRCLKD